jgi:tetratricopeptide (TPR) repeat protein
MKKTILTLAAASLAITAVAQRAKVREANNYLASGEVDKAQRAIDEAVTDAKTSTEPRTWAVRGQVYLAMQNVEAMKASNPYQEGAKSLLKAAELGEKEGEINQSLKVAAFYYFNDGIKAARAEQFQSAVDYFGQVNTLHKVDGGARTKGDKQFDTVASQASLQRILAASKLEGKSADLATMLESAKADPIIRQPYLYYLLAETYQKMGDETKALNAFAEGKKAFPTDKDLIAGELNLYIKSGRTAEMLTKMEEAAQQDAGNADLQFNLGNAYLGAAFPKDGSTPANYKEAITKAESAYTKALALKGDVADFQYNAGTLYYNQAAEFNKQMNAISGTSTAEMRKADALKLQRDAMFAKAQPYFEKVVTLVEAKGASMSEDDKVTYKSSLYGLREIYQRMNDAKKGADVKAKLDSLK